MKVTHNDILQWRKNPPEKQTDQIDDSGLIVRRNLDGSIAFCARKRIGGRRMRKTFGRYPELSLAEARKEARAWLSNMVPEVEIGRRRRRRTTWGEVVEAYLNVCKVRAKSYKQIEYMFRRYPPDAWWPMPAEDLTKVRVNDFLLSMNGTRQPNHMLVFLKAALNYAVRMDMIKVNPIRDLERPYREKPRKHVLDFEQLRRVWEGCEQVERIGTKALQLLMLTGCRPGEILTRRWKDVGSDRWLLVPDNKAERPHKVYLADLAWEIIESLPTRAASPFLFPSPVLEDKPISTIRQARDEVAEIARIGSWQSRDFRSTFLSHSVEHCGVLPVVAKVCANHRIEGVTDENYLVRTAYYPACKEAWIAWDRLVQGIISGNQGQVVSLSAASGS